MGKTPFAAAFTLFVLVLSSVPLDGITTQDPTTTTTVQTPVVFALGAESTTTAAFVQTSSSATSDSQPVTSDSTTTDSVTTEIVTSGVTPDESTSLASASSSSSSSTSSPSTTDPTSTTTTVATMAATLSPSPPSTESTTETTSTTTSTLTTQLTTTAAIYAPCSSYTCRNGGCCIANSNQPSGLTCYCQPLYTGSACENTIVSPPTCSAQNVTEVFLDSTHAGTRSLEKVNCSTHQGVLLNFTETVAPPGPFVIVADGGSPDTDSVLLFRVLVTEDLLYWVGQYELTVFVHNELGLTALNWHITVDDDNQRPAFNKSYYAYDVGEDNAIGSILATVHVQRNGTGPAGLGVLDPEPIIVWDPDNYTVMYEFKEMVVTGVDTEYPNGTITRVPSQSGLPIQLVDNPWRFEVMSQLSPGFQYDYTLQARDGANEIDEATVSFVVVLEFNANAQPTCEMTSPTLSLDLVTPVGAVVYILNCSDSDVNDTLSRMTYVENRLASGYFGVNQSGFVTLKARVPVDVNALTYSVQVKDDGGLSVDVNITFLVNRNYPPQCGPRNISVSMPEDAATAQCVKASLNCGHDSALDTYNLTMNVSLTHTTYFSVSSVPSKATTASPVPTGTAGRSVTYSMEFVFTVCPNVSLLGKYGLHDWDITVASALGSTRYNGNITVSDTNQAPQFQQPLYRVDVSEMTQAGTTVAQVMTSIGPGSSPVPEIFVTDSDTLSQYRFNNVTLTEVVIVYPNSTNVTVPDQFGLPIQFASSSLSFYVAFNSSRAGMTFRFTLQARDFGGLTNTTLVIFTVRDVNQPPTCPPVTSQTLAIVRSPGEAVYTWSCTDLDVNETLSSLTFDEKNILDFDYFSINQSGVIFLTQRVPLNRTTLTYSVHVVDGGGLSADANITFNINRNFPPQCSAQNITVLIPEDAPTTQCGTINLLCGHDSALDTYNLPINVTSSTNSTYFTVSSNATAGTVPGSVTYNVQFVFTVCPIVSLLGKYGHHNWNITVASALGSTQYNGNITVMDTNQAPQFQQPLYQVDVSEKTPSDTTVAKVVTSIGPGSSTVLEILVTDSDTLSQYINSTVTVTEVVTVYPNSTNVTAQSQVGFPIQLGGSGPSWYFVVYFTLPPGVIYRFKLQAQDLGGLRNTTIVVFTILDINEVPSCQTVTSLPLDLLTLPGKALYNFSCSDSDVTETLSKLDYIENTILDYNYFHVDHNGTVFLTNPVPLNRTTLIYNVRPMDGGGLSIDVNITFTINGNYPPRCTPAAATSTFLETAGSPECASVNVTCADTASRNLIPLVNIISDDTKGKIGIRKPSTGTTNNTGWVQLNACVTSTSGSLTIGQFIMKLNISNVLGSTTFQWNITIEDVNEAPSFELPTYNTTVSEKVAIGTTLAVVRNKNDTVGTNTPLDIVMRDPDTVTDNFTIKYLTFVVRAEYTDGRPFENSFNMTTRPVNLTTRALLVQTMLRPDLVYIVILTAEDGGGLKANTTLYIRVNDVNDPPSCDPVLPVNLTLVTPASTKLLTLTCSDHDFNSSFRSISYFAYTEANYTFFNVSATGNVILASAVPRDALRLTLKAYVVDGGGLRNNITVTFTVFRNYTPTCTPTITPPSVWRKDECFRLIPNCRDPAAPQGNNSFIRYSFGGDFMQAFRENVSLTGSDFAEFCYNLITNGTFNVQLTADSGLGTFVWDQQLNVRYLSETPRFEFNQYQTKIPETTNISTIVLTVRATVGTGLTAVQVHYSLEGGNQFTQYFGIDPKTGQVNVTANLKNVVSSSLSSLSTRVWARDPDTGQNSSVLISIDIEDVNQQPSCANASVNVTVPWTVDMGLPVANVTCTDADPTTAFNTLTYDMLPAGIGGVTWTVHPRTGEVSLVSRSSLSPDIGKYELTVQANDNTFTDVAKVTIYVNRTAPRPTVQVTYIGSNSATFSWTTSSVYLSVIDGYTVSVRDSQGSVIDNTTVNATQNIMTYTTTTPLTATTSYSVVVTVRGKGGDVTSDPMPFTTEEVAVLKKASTEIKLTNETWTRELLDNQSAAFKGLQSRLAIAVGGSALSRLPGFVSVFVRSFRNGSVYADLVITINQKTQTTDLETNLTNLIQRGSIGDLAVDRQYKPFYLSETYMTDVTIELTATRSVNISNILYVIVDADVTVTCHVRTPGISALNFRWLMNGSEINNTYRYEPSPSLLRSEDDPYGFYSHLNISNVVLADGGTLTCNVSGGTSSLQTSKTLTVKTGLSVTLTPPTSVVRPPSDVTLNCTRAAGYHVDWTAVLYRKENNQRSQVMNKTSLPSETIAIFTVPKVSANAEFQCDVTDAGGNSVSGNADVFILKQDDVQCPSDGNWIATPAGTNFSLKCPNEYEGAFYRICGADGTWGPVNSSGCVRQELKNIKQDMEQFTTNASQAVERLVQVTQKSLLQGDILVAVDILDRVANDSVTRPPDNDTLKNFIRSADNVLQAPTDIWHNRTLDAFSLVRSVDTIGEAASRGLGDHAMSVHLEPVSTDKIVLQVGRSAKEDIVFPIRSRAGDYPAWLMETKNSAFLSKDALPDGVTSVQYSAVMFRNLSNVFSGALHGSLLAVGTDSELSVNTPILTLSVTSLKKSINPPVTLTFEHVWENFSAAQCQFLDFSKNLKGRWSSGGCTVVSTNRTSTVCSCDHLTNFAVLMSPYRPTGITPEILTIITIVGCAISIFCLFVTIVVYGVLWRYVKSDRSVVLVNLCVVLLLAYVVFLAGVSRTENEIACKVVSALLHYLFLVVFFLMLCEGLDIFISIVIIFPIKSVLVKLLIMAYGAPAIVVAVSLGVRLEGYGGPDTCWLSLKDGLVWAFIGPALAALLANFVFVALVIRALLSSTHLLTKSQRERAKSIVKAICVMTPILGLTWVFGVFYVNEETVAFQYLFLIFNTLQGLFIFIFHCLLSKQVRDGLKSKRRRYQARSSDVGSKSASHVSQKITSESSMSSSNDLDTKTISPFLQVDRQVQQMAAKVSRLEDINLFTTDDPPKNVAAKDTGVPMAMSNPAFYFASSGAAPNIRSGYSGLLSVERKLSTDYAELATEAGNVTSVAKPTEYGVSEGKFPVKKVGSLEDNAQQTGGGRRQSKKSEGSGSKASSSHGARPKELNSKERTFSDSRSPFTNVDQQQRLDHIYGAGARISDSTNSSDKHQKRNAPHGGRTSLSSDDVTSFSVHKNPVYNDVVPPLSPTDRWLSGAPTSGLPVRHQHPLDPRFPQQTPQYPTPPFQQPVRPSSPRRLSASADHLGKNVTAIYHPFSGVRGEPVDHHGNKRPPPRVAPKPGRGRGGGKEPPVDYW